MNRTWGIRHWTQSIRDVGSADRRESVAGVRCTCGLDVTWQSASVKDLRSTREVSDEVLGANGGRARVP